MYQITAVVHGIKESIEIEATSRLLASSIARATLAKSNGVCPHTVFITGIIKI